MLWLAVWSAASAAFGYAALLTWRLTLLRRSPVSTTLVLALAGMAFWSASLASNYFALSTIGKTIRDLAWLGYLYATTRGFDQETQTRRRIASAVLLLGALAIAQALVTVAILTAENDTLHELVLVSLILGWLLPIGGVFFVHLLYRSLTSASGSGFRLILLALGIMWAYDINLITVTLLGFAQAPLLMTFQGIFAFLLLPAFGLAARRNQRWKVTLSRKAATSSLLLMAIGTYFVAISAISRALIWAAHNDEVFKIVLAMALSLGFAVVTLFPRIARIIKKILLEHLFEHRYDYRAEWLRFSATIGDRSKAGLSPEERIIRSVADVTESPSGLLLLVSRGVELSIAGSWNWQYALPVGLDLPVDAAWLRWLAQTSRIITLDEIREHELGPGDELVPGWLLDAEKAWAGVPLVRGETLIGLIVLGRPTISRMLDWEDFDLLKVIGQQVAMHLADAQSQAELEQARQFDEFNRRFAFIIHDIKNVVSQLSLVASNAAEHGANPRFQQSMARTLASATAKMTVLLARLSADGPTSPSLDRVELGRFLTEIADTRHAQHPIVLAIEEDCQVDADAEQLRQAIDHLIQNAIEASPARTPIELTLAKKRENAHIIIKDRGVGMSREFVRKQLFKPFASTKQGGFGIGAAEAKALIEAMGGGLDVLSVEGAGTQFSIVLPLLNSVGADADTGAESDPAHAAARAGVA
jgi:putative PEP-CTERM system histidine kinase